MQGASLADLSDEVAALYDLADRCLLMAPQVMATLSNPGTLLWRTVSCPQCPTWPSAHWLQLGSRATNMGPSACARAQLGAWLIIVRSCGQVLHGQWSAHGYPRSQACFLLLKPSS